MIGLLGMYLVIRSGAGLLSFLHFMFIDPYLFSLDCHHAGSILSFMLACFNVFSFPCKHENMLA